MPIQRFQKVSARVFAGVLLCAFLAACRIALPIDPQDRPATWAQPVALSGAPKLQKVSDDLYRGGQPTAQGFRNLAALGIRTVIDLRVGHTDLPDLAGTGLRYVHIPVDAWNLNARDIDAFLAVVRETENGPFFVHCLYGADRTGTMTAAYRICIQGWDKAEAIREMTRGGFGYHPIWKGLPKVVQECPALDSPSTRPR